MANPEREIAMFQDFAALLGLAVGPVSNPNTTGSETGMDVVTVLAGKRIGAQLTDYHADEHRTAGPRKKTLRSQEEKKAKQASERNGAQVYGTWASAEFIPPLVYRVREKITKAGNYPVSVDELWLLVCAQDPRWGATSSTFIASAMVSVDVLNQHVSPPLFESSFDRMFLFLCLERVVYGWTKATNHWELIKDKPEQDKEHVEATRKLLFDRGRHREQWLADPDGMAERAIDEILGRQTKGNGEEKA
jgi:hypothetical protein